MKLRSQKFKNADEEFLDEIWLTYRINEIILKKDED